jgi:hypothetical protein
MSDNINNEHIQITPEQLSIIKRLDANILVAESNLIDAQQQRVKWLGEQEFKPVIGERNSDE